MRGKAPDTRTGKSLPLCSRPCSTHLVERSSLWLIQKLKEVCFPPLKSARSLAHDPERWVCAQPNTGTPSYSLRSKKEKAKLLIFHGKQILISIALYFYFSHSA